MPLKHIEPFQKRLKYSHPSLKVSPDYAPLLPDELLYGIDWENRDEKYYPEDIKKIEVQLEKVIGKIKRNPKLVKAEVERRYKPLTQYLPKDFKNTLYDGLEEVDDYIAEHKLEGGVVERLSHEMPDSIKNLSPKDIADKAWGAIEDVAKSERPLASFGDLFNVGGEVAGGIFNEAANRLQQAGVYGGSLLRGSSEEDAFQKARDIYAKEPLLNLDLRPAATSEPTKAGDILRTILGSVGEGVNWAIDKGSESIFSPDIAERVKDLAKIGLAVTPTVGAIGKVGRRGLGKLRKGPTEAPQGVGTDFLDKIAQAQDVPSLLEAQSEAPSILQRDKILKLVEEAVSKGKPTEQQLSEIIPSEAASKIAATNFDPDLVRKALVDTPVESVPMGPIPEAATGIAEKFKEFWNPFANLPEAEKYLAIRGAARGFGSTLSEMTSPIIKEAKALPPPSRQAIFQAIENANPLSLSAKEANLYKQVVLLNDYLGEALTERGYVDPKAFETLRGSYMPQKYLSDFFAKEESPMASVGSGTQMGLELTKSRELSSKIEQKARGKIEDVGVAVEGYTKAAGKILSADNLFNDVVSNPNWVWKDSFVDVPLVDGGTARILRSELPSQIAAQRRVVATVKDPEIKALASSRLELLEETASSGAPPAHFKQVPDAPGYGPLRGLYVHKSIAQDIVGFFNPLEKMDLQSPLVRKMADLAQSSVGTWKVIKTVLNVPSWLRNFGEAAVRLDLSGVDWHQMPRLYWKAAQEMKTGGPLYREAQARGLLSTTFSDVELKPATELIKGWLRDSDWFSMMSAGPTAVVKNLPAFLRQSLASGSDRALTFAQHVYQSGDSLMALAKYISEREGGKSAASAIEATLPWSMDYSVASPTIQGMRRFMFPFVSYQYKVMPLLLKAVREHPTKFVKYQAAPYVYSNIMDVLSSDISSDEARSIIDIYPETVRRMGSAYLFPTRTATGGLTLLSTDYFFPWSSITEAARVIPKGDVRGGTRLIAFGNPWLDLYSMIATSRNGMMYDAFTGKELWNPLDSTTTKIMKFSGKLSENLALPSFATSSGALGKALTLMFDQDAAEKKDLGWRDVTLSMLGITSKPLNVRQQKMMADYAARDVAEHWGRYEKNTTDPVDMVEKKRREYQETMFLLKHPDARRPPASDAEKYNIDTRVAPGQELSDPNVILDLLTNPKRSGELLYNLPTSDLVGKNR